MALQLWSEVDGKWTFHAEKWSRPQFAFLHFITLYFHHFITFPSLHIPQHLMVLKASRITLSMSCAL